MPRRLQIRSLLTVALSGAVLVAALYTWSVWIAGSETRAQAVVPRDGTAQSAHFVGSASCSQCHQAQHTAWAASHHAASMQEASEATVLGRFDGATFTHSGVTTTFLRRNGRFVVRTDGPDGKLADFEIKYTFGITPLQQYLIELPGGKLQAFGIAWDSRPESAGGQRWYHLYPDMTLAHGDPLHWTGIDQNWNYQCAC